MMRLLLAVLVAAMLGFAGCEKKEPTAAERLDQLQQDAEKTTEQAQEEAKEATQEAEKTVEQTQDAAEEAVK